MNKPDLRLLLIEDVASDAELIMYELRKAGLAFQAKCVAGKKEFLGELRKERVDAIISDFSMPQFNALDALRALKTHNVEVPFILVTGSQSEEVAVNCIKEGADDYILKSSLTRLPTALLGAIQKKKAEQEREQARQALQQSEEYFRSLIDASSDIITLLSEEGTIRYESPSLQRHLGYSLNELTGKKYLELVHPNDISQLQGVIERELRHPNTSTPVEYRFQAKDGNWRCLETMCRNYLHSPAVSGLVLNSRDITERKKLESHFLRAQRMESIGTLAGGIAHDLNNVLTPILMSLKLLRDLRECPPKTVLDTLETTAHRGAAIVQQVLSFARGVEGERAILQLKYPLNEVIKIAKDVFPPSIQISAAIDPELWPVNGDPTQLHQVFMNLFVNARDAMPAGGRLRVETQNVVLDENFSLMQAECKPGRYVVTTVTDTGAGISQDIINKIFDPFFTTKEPGKGTGLGLSTALGIVRGHGGFLNVYSESGRGASFKVYLPAAQASKDECPKKVETRLPSGNGESILVVDDEAAIREIIKVTLENNGYRVITATDGTEAVAAFAARPKSYAAVIVDVMMPYMDGPSTIRALQKLSPATPFLAISGLMETSRLARLTELGVELLAKPFTTEQILTVLANLLKKACPTTRGAHGKPLKA